MIARSRLLPAPQSFAWYPTLVVAAFILGDFAAIDVSPYAMFRSLIVGVAVVAAIGVSLAKLLRSSDRGGIATVVVMAALLTWGDHRVLFAVIALVVVAVLLERLPQRRISPTAITSSFNVFAAVLLMVVVLQGSLSGRWIEAASDVAIRPSAVPAVASDAPSHPDIYLIVLDGYARPDTLRTRFGLDPTPFLASLARAGLEPSLESRSNYDSTALTLTSMLNMGYLEDIPAVSSNVAWASSSEDPQTDGRLRDAINDNRAFARLRANGYEIVSIGSGWEQVAVRRADSYVDGGELNTFELTLFHQLPGLAAVAEAIAPDIAGDQARARVDDSLAALQRIGRSASVRPRFVMLHLMVPHQPIIYGKAGEPIPVDLSDPLGVRQFDLSDAAEHYASQVRYLNERISAAIGDLAAVVPPSSTIVLMSDHGSRYGTGDRPPTGAPEAVKNLFLARTPGHPGLFGTAPTPVNLFPTLFNAYLGASLPVLPDRSFVSTPDDSLGLTEVYP